MLNINSVSSGYNTHVKGTHNHINTSNNRIAERIQRVTNVSINPITIRNLSAEVVDEITKYCSIDDIHNFNEANIYSEIDPCRHIVKVLRQWQKEYPQGIEENRKLAVEKIIDCARRKVPFLNLNYLNLTSLPDLKPFTFITGLTYEGNDNQVILDCFEKYKHHFFKLKECSILPRNLNYVVMNYHYSTYRGNDHYNTYLWRVEHYGKTVFAIGDIGFLYEDNFERDFLNLYRL